MIRAQFQLYAMGVQLFRMPKEYQPGDPYDKADFLTKEQAQMLFQDLWDGGFRPEEDRASPAMKAHLEDMRKIAFDLLERIRCP